MTGLLGPAGAGGLWRPDRRRLLRSAGLGAAALALGPRHGAAAAGLPADRTFDVIRKGSRIGEARIRFRPDGEDGLLVTTTWDLAVKLVGVTVYAYRQRGEDRWRGGRLVASDIATEDDGKKTRVRLSEEGGRLKVEGPKGGYATDPGTMTDLCFWNRKITEQTRLIDGQNADLGEVKVGEGAADTIKVRGATVRATRYHFVGKPSDSGKGRDGDIWYDEAGRWVHGEMNTRGESLTIRLAG